MPCPLFLTDTETCAAQPELTLPRDLIRRACLPGYARHVCVHAAGVEADAVRLLVKSHQGGVIEIAWSLEINHHPLAVGTIAVNSAQQGADSTLQRQAKALASEYLRRTGQE